MTTLRQERIRRYDAAIAARRRKIDLEQARRKRAEERTPLPLEDFLEEVAERAARGDIPEVIAAGLSVTLDAVYNRLRRNGRLDLWEAARANEYPEHDWSVVA